MELCEARSDGRALKIFKYMSGPDGLWFSVDFGRKDDESTFYGTITIIAGKRAAKKYRAELRIFSNEMVNSVTYYGPVLSLDERAPFEHQEAFEISSKKFAVFNNGFDYFGDHNKDKNGEIVMPIAPKITKLELGIPTA